MRTEYDNLVYRFEQRFYVELEKAEEGKKFNDTYWMSIGVNEIKDFLEYEEKQLIKSHSKINKSKIEYIIRDLNEEMEVHASNKVKKEVNDCYREVLTKHLIN